MNPPSFVTRRRFLRDGSLLLLAAGATTPRTVLADEPPPARLARFGLLTDLHYADKPTRGSRHYRESLDKLQAAGEQLRRAEPDAIVELGDLIDAAPDVDDEQRWLASIYRPFSKISDRRHCVLGNHCVDTLTKQEFLAGVEQPRSYYSFDISGVHGVVLDACFRSDGEPYGRRNFQWTDPNIPADQLEWLRQDLAATRLPTVVFAHQRLDVGQPYGVRNAKAVRKILEDSQRVLAVFQGHSHKNEHRQIGDIHYCTLVAMVEGAGADNSGFATLDVLPEGNLLLTGFLRQQDYRW
ncbi:MAG: metallophosphoesterase [Pirellulales bacterium]